jgi:hypothetical protein
MREERMAGEKGDGSAKTIWAYAYEIVPPQAEDRLRTVKTLLDDENSGARLGGGTWTGRVVREQQITHILVVSDSPEQDREVNRKLEAELTELKAGFRLTAPMAVERS